MDAAVLVTIVTLSVLTGVVGAFGTLALMLRAMTLTPQPVEQPRSRPASGR
jgi:hypothetical protein